ncbi:hypothetical protein PCANC_03664 [Puccinia coronata f. sp. avenae]|uniref:Uncharacterized protein n=1 Tax=Puccinia coronata f. sp. avenae TaxID=200324 RepID=A0A2N5VXS2_9BASI|nr:hypothetical protein PCASD_03778 [Puccinia coronata f. sp. avenae]PLW54732.1 hypothetical protein PCANC_03664 [Puccinia coronata f. sp. avenae]
MDRNSRPNRRAEDLPGSSPGGVRPAEALDEQPMPMPPRQPRRRHQVAWTDFVHMLPPEIRIHARTVYDTYRRLETGRHVHLPAFRLASYHVIHLITFIGTAFVTGLKDRFLNLSHVRFAEPLCTQLIHAREIVFPSLQRDRIGGPALAILGGPVDGRPGCSVSSGWALNRSQPRRRASRRYVRQGDGDGVAFVAGASITGCSSTNVASVLADELRFAFAVAVGAFKGLSPFDRTNARNASSLSGVTADRAAAEQHSAKN